MSTKWRAWSRATWRAVWVFALVSIPCLVPACRTAERPEEAQERRKEEAKSKVIARVNGEPVSMADYEASLDALPPFARRAIHGETAYRRFMSDVIRFVLLHQEAAKRGLGSDPDVQLAVRNALADELWRSLADKASGEGGDDATLDAHVAAHPERYRTPDGVTIVQLFTRDAQRARRLRSTFLLAMGIVSAQGGSSTRQAWLEAFTKFAERRSEERGTAVVLGPLTAADGEIIAPAAVVEAALQMGNDAEVALVDTAEGAYLFMVKEHHPGSAMSTLEARSRARQEVLDAAQLKQRERLAQELVEGADIEILDPTYAGALDKLRQ